MKEIAEQFIQNYFKDLVEHHKSIFGLHKDANVNEVNYIAVHEDIFAFINHLCQIDETYEEELLDVMLDDIVNLVQFINSLSGNGNKNLELIYSKFIKIHDVVDNKNDFFEIIKKEFKLNKNILLSLLNTKFFYLDKYIWHKIKQSKELRQLLKIKNLQEINSTLKYIKHTKIKKSYMKLDYSSFHIQLDKKYNEKGIQHIKSLDKEKSDLNPNCAIEQLIRYKNHIPYFRDIEEDDIREIVKDVKFLHYGVHEILIKEFDKSNEIFFLVEGECRVSLKRRALGTILKESIFGEFSFITKQPRSATVKTNKDSIIISFHFDLESFDNNPCLFSQLYKNISEELVKKVYNMNKEHISV